MFGVAYLRPHIDPVGPMKKILIFLTSCYPYGEGETFVANEIPHLTSAFDEIIVLTNDTVSEQARPFPGSVTCVRQPYELGTMEKMRSLLGLLSPAVWQEIHWVRTRYRRSVDGRILATALVSWLKAGKFARIIRRLAARVPEAEVHVYSYWASDMAVAAAVARRKAWVHRAYCRAHRWDVYVDGGGFLPFRHLLATRLDHYLFVSEHGRRYFETLMGRSYPSVGCSRLGTPPVSPAPLARVRPFTLLSCSALIPRKRVELIAEALSHVTSDVRWIHIGEGPSRGTVEAACAELPTHVNAELRGGLPNPEVLGLYATLRPSLFLSVSRSEGLPVSMMEAMSAGIPVMATDVDGVCEIVSHGSNGVLLPPNPTAHEVASAIDTFASMPESEHAGYAQRAWATWSADFNADRNYETFLRMTQA
jgi:glycosyltransferase involved in cell wall biosynthesis